MLFQTLKLIWQQVSKRRTHQNNFYVTNTLSSFLQRSMCQIASSVDRWIRHLRVSRIKSLSRAVGIKKNRRGKAFEVSIICSPHWNQTKYGEDQSSSPYTFRRLCLSQKGISLTKTNERFRILCMGPPLRHVPAHCIHHCIV